MQVQIYDHLTQNQVNTYGLVLSSQGVPHFIRKNDHGWAIWVDLSFCDHAYDSIAQYIDENQNVAIGAAYKAPEYKKAYIGLWMALIIIGCHLYSHIDGQFDLLVRQYGASARAILNGDLFRTVTALMLHSDYVHLASNAVGIFIFGNAVGRVAGVGVGSLMIFCTGALGNYANALLFEYNHLSIGASTAVFGAVGILSAYQFLTKLKIGTGRIKALLPLAGGMALLAFLGASEHADLTAHLFGFAAGIGLGILYALNWRHFQPQSVQMASMAACVFMAVLAWV